MIPEWNIEGLIPPIMPGQPGHSHVRSPYQVDIIEFVSYFCTSPQRARLIDGLLRYRKALYRLGVTEGFQWVDGSFLEQIELRDNRDPNDIDVVTFFVLPDGVDQQGLYVLFDSSHTKETFSIDAYPFVLNPPIPEDGSRMMRESDIQMISYWYSLWSHTREGSWKGFVRIALSEDKDQDAAVLLQQLSEENGYELR